MSPSGHPPGAARIGMIRIGAPGAYRVGEPSRASDSSVAEMRRQPQAS